MKKKLKTPLLTAVILIVCFVIISILMLIKKEDVKPFYREATENLIQDTQHFRVDRVHRHIFFKNGKNEQALEGIPSINGNFFYLNGKKQIKLHPKFSGEIGLYMYLHLKSKSKRQVIDFSLIINRNGKDIETNRIAADKIIQPLFQELTVEKGDILLLRFQGKGIVYFSQPIVYKKFQSQNLNQCKHIFFIGIDTLRGDQIGEIVKNQALTPNMTRFKEDSVYFENAYAQTSWTLPSFMSLFTGQYEFNHGVGIKESLDQTKPFLVEQLTSNFITFAYHGGKVMGGRWGFSRGFDYYNKYQPAASLYPKGGQSLFKKAIELLEQSHFPNLFLFLHTYQVHAPYTPPKEFLYKLNPTPKYFKLDPVNFSEPAKTYIPAEDQMKHALKELYQAEILAFDTYFGEFLNKLKEMNLYDNAMIILMADHGEEFFEHYGWAHSHSLYDELIHVPVFIKFPGNRFKNTIIQETIGLIDIFPTILSYYKLPYDSENLDGINLLPIIRKNKTIKPREFVISTISTGKYFDAFPNRLSFRFGEYKLIYNEPYEEKDLKQFQPYTLPPQPPLFELYNIKTDPQETNNIVETHSKLKEKMLPIVLNIQKLIKKKSIKSSKKKLDEEVKKQLESLGYL